MSIYNYLSGYKADRFHTPGHKGKLDSFDITEIPFEFPERIIVDAEAGTAQIYGAENLRYLIGGSSLGMKAAILAAGREGIVTESYRHSCVDGGAKLARTSLHIIEGTKKQGADLLPQLPTAADITAALSETGAQIAVIQYPDYYGRCPDLEEIFDAVSAQGKLLIADSAHGAHFAFRPDLFPKSATLLSDACNLSAHKTLCAYTQSAYVAFSNKLDAEKIDAALAVLGTTSPNYVMLAQLEKAAETAKSVSAAYDRLKQKLAPFYERLPTLENADFTRLVIDCRAIGGGEAVFRTLRQRGITAEKFDQNYIVFILTPFDDDEAIDGLYAQLREIMS